MANYRQEVFNVLLAQLLQERGIISSAENIIYAGVERNRRMPDVTIVSFQGLRTIIEAEVGSTPEAQAKALASARRRVEEGIAAACLVPSHEFDDDAFGRSGQQTGEH